MMKVFMKYASSVFFPILRAWSLYILSALILVIPAACDKNVPAPQLTPSYDVYMAGSVERQAVYWKNGVPVVLNENGSVYAIRVIGSDIYACGVVYKLTTPDSLFSGITTVATYWKNGEEIPLTNQYGSGALEMAIQDNDIYVVGYLPNADSVGNAVYWKNGIVNYLSPESWGTAWGIAISGQQIYISGETFSMHSDSAIVWKNGQKNYYGEIGRISSIAFHGTDTFYVGMLNYAPSYWLQDKIKILYEHGSVLGLAFSGTDVYYGGYIRNGLEDNYPAIWKNDSLTVLTEQFTNSAVSAIAIAGRDVYAGGYINNQFTGVSPVYWKNGQMEILGSNGQVNSIFVVH